MKIGELCTRDTFIIQKDDNIVEAAKLMRVFNVGDLIVVTASQEGNTPIGIVTDRDIVVSVVADNADPQNVKVVEIMSKELVTGREDATILSCLNIVLTKLYQMDIPSKTGYLTLISGFQFDIERHLQNVA